MRLQLLGSFALQDAHPLAHFPLRIKILLKDKSRISLLLKSHQVRSRSQVDLNDQSNSLGHQLKNLVSGRKLKFKNDFWLDAEWVNTWVHSEFSYRKKQTIEM